MAKVTVKEQTAMKKQAQQILRMQGKDYDEFIYSIHKEICIDGQDLIVKALENEAIRLEEENKRKLIEKERKNQSQHTGGQNG